MSEFDILIPLSDKEHIIIEVMKQQGNISMGKATEICGYKTKSATRKLIDKLIQKNIIEKTGNGPATRYIIKNKEL